MSNLLNKMMQKEGLNAPLDPKRAKIADEITRTVINEALREAKAKAAERDAQIIKPNGAETK